MTEVEINALTERIIVAAIRVRKELGLGFLEKVYENAICVELRESGLEVEQQKPISVQYHGCIVGEYIADLVVAGTVIVELKAARAIDPVHIAQCLNYLKATGLGVGLLLNFGPAKLEFKRLVGPAFRGLS
ncbi:MAG: GxxExxY protein [Phycisphaerales bacterium]|nr:GxxExxY protein [Phycisphaerales bacterium]